MPNISMEFSLVCSKMEVKFWLVFVAFVFVMDIVATDFYCSAKPCRIVLDDGSNSVDSSDADSVIKVPIVCPLGHSMDADGVCRYRW